MRTRTMVRADRLWSVEAPLKQCRVRVESRLFRLSTAGLIVIGPVTRRRFVSETQLEKPSRQVGRHLWNGGPRRAARDGEDGAPRALHLGPRVRAREHLNHRASNRPHVGSSTVPPAQGHPHWSIHTCVYIHSLST